MLAPMVAAVAALTHGSPAVLGASASEATRLQPQPAVPEVKGRMAWDDFDTIPIPAGIPKDKLGQPLPGQSPEADEDFDVGVAPAQPGTKHEGGANRRNVLMLVADDLRPMISGLDKNHYHMHTPHLSGFMDNALTLANSHVQQAVCSPSRTSVLFGRRPSTTHVYDMETYARDRGCVDCLTIPGLFKEAGYWTMGAGKVFHEGPPSGNSDKQSWSETGVHLSTNPATTTWGYFQGYDSGPGMCQSTQGDDVGGHVSWRAVNEAKTGLCVDSQIREHAKGLIKQAAAKRAKGQPFFLAVGFHKPHLPFVVPAEFFAMYDKSQTKLAPNQYAPVGMPPIALENFELPQFDDIKSLGWRGGVNQTLPAWKQRDLVHAYQAALSYADHNIGSVINALKATPGLWSTTVVVFWSDHGFKLGHHGAWSKHTNFEEDTLAPVLLRVPGVTDGKRLVSHALVEHVDIMATLVRAVGLEHVPTCPATQPWTVARCTEGTSFLPLVTAPDRPWKKAVFSWFPRSPDTTPHLMGYSMRTGHTRFTAWVEFNLNESNTHWHMRDSRCGFELYDLAHDPGENFNLAHSPALKERISTSFEQLKNGWRHALPHVGPSE